MFPYSIQKWASVTANLAVAGACLWFVVAGAVYLTHWPLLGGVLVGLTCVQAILGIAGTAVYRRLRRRTHASLNKLAAAYAFGLMPVIIFACVVITGLLLHLAD